MSRSYRHHPIFGFTTCRSEKEYKQREHRRLRVALRLALSREDWERAEYDVRESVWEWGKDGKQRDPDSWDPENCLCTHSQFRGQYFATGNVCHGEQICTHRRFRRGTGRYPFWQYFYK